MPTVPKDFQRKSNKLFYIKKYAQCCLAFQSYPLLNILGINSTGRSKSVEKQKRI